VLLHTEKETDVWDFWHDLPPVLRAALDLAVVGVAAVIWLATGGRLYAVGLGAVGLAMLLFCTTGNDKSGYNF
jgi:hypothetical protein